MFIQVIAGSINTLIIVAGKVGCLPKYRIIICVSGTDKFVASLFILLWFGALPFETLGISKVC